MNLIILRNNFEIPDRSMRVARGSSADFIHGDPAFSNVLLIADRSIKLTDSREFLLAMVIYSMNLKKFILVIFNKAASKFLVIDEKITN